MTSKEIVREHSKLTRRVVRVAERPVFETDEETLARFERARIRATATRVIGGDNYVLYKGRNNMI